MEYHREQITTTGESHKHNVVQKKPDTKEYPTYIKLNRRQNQPVIVQVSMMVTLESEGNDWKRD